jgi:hypothetical protein
VLDLISCVPRGALDVYYAQSQALVASADALIRGKEINFALDDDEGGEDVEVEKKESLHTDDGRLKRKKRGTKSKGDDDDEEEDDDKEGDDAVEGDGGGGTATADGDGTGSPAEELTAEEAKAKRAADRAMREAAAEAKAKALAKAAAELEAARREEERIKVAGLPEAMQRCFQCIKVTHVPLLSSPPKRTTPLAETRYKY